MYSTHITWKCGAKLHRAAKSQENFRTHVYYIICKCLSDRVKFVMNVGPRNSKGARSRRLFFVDRAQFDLCARSLGLRRRNPPPEGHAPPWSLAHAAGRDKMTTTASRQLCGGQVREFAAADQWTAMCAAYARITFALPVATTAAAAAVTVDRTAGPSRSREHFGRGKGSAAGAGSRLEEII